MFKVRKNYFLIHISHLLYFVRIKGFEIGHSYLLLILGPNKKFKERKSFADPRIIDHEGNTDTIRVFFSVELTI